MIASLRIAMVQDNFLVGDIQGNTEIIRSHIASAMEAGIELLIFPELALTGYPPEDLLLRDDFIEEVEASLIEIASVATDIDVLVGAPVRAEGELFNAALWMHDGSIITSYNKRRLPNYSVFDEKRYFSTGDRDCIVELGGIRFGVLICEDVWDAGLVAKHEEADAIIVINASPYHVEKYQERLDVLMKSSASNGLSIIYVNLVGGQDELVFDGESMLIANDGSLVHRCVAFETCVQEFQYSPDTGFEVDAPKTSGLGYEASVYRCLVLGVRDFVRKNGFEGVVLGLSGGVDSALTLAIAVDALGADQVHAVLLPSMYTADMSNEDAILEADALGVHYDIVPIEPAYNAFMSSLKGVFEGMAPDTTEENIQARCRGLILMAISNKTGRMLLTTGNKSEVAVGYATLYGDMNGGFAPLKDVPKTLVYRLCRHRNIEREVIPERVLTRPPSAELREDQCDQDSLPDYDILDRILEMWVEQDRSIEEIAATGIERSTVEHIVGLIQRNEYKRRQAAPGIRISRRAFGKDRRYPIVSGHRRPVR